MRKLLRAGARVLLVIGLVLVTVITVQAHAERQERVQFPPAGEMVDIGRGQLIHVRTWGARTSPTDPAIVLDVSAAMPSSAWAWIGAALAADGYHVVAYDRPGMGWSTGSWQPRDSGRAADALVRALDAAAIEQPYIVVGHSYGGFSARVFTGRNRDAVTGLVLLDTTHPDGGGERGFALGYRLRAWQGHAGLLELHSVPSGFAELPAEERDAADAVSTWTSHLDATAEELEAWPTSAEQVRAANLQGLPVLIVSTPGEDSHVDLQRDMLNLSSRSQFAQVEASHMGMLLNRDQAQLVVEQIEEFIAAL